MLWWGQCWSHLSWWLPAPGLGGRWPWLLSWPVAGGVRLSVQGWWWGWREHWAPPGSSRLTAATGCLSRDQSSWRDVLVSGSHWSHWFAAGRAGSDEAQLSLPSLQWWSQHTPHHTPLLPSSSRTTERGKNNATWSNFWGFDSFLAVQGPGLLGIYKSLPTAGQPH